MKKKEKIKKCDRCLRMEIKCVHSLPAVPSWGNFEGPSFSPSFEYVMNRVGDDGLCGECRAEISKIKYDKQIIK